MKHLSIFLVLTLGAAAARADPETLYLGAGITHNNVSNFAVANANPESTVGYPNISATSWKALLGFRPIRAFAIELDYFGTAATDKISHFNGFESTQRSEASALAAYALGLLPSEHLDLYLKAGLERYKLTAVPDQLGAGGTDTGTGFACGVGAQWRYGHVGIRVEYEWLPSMGKTDGMQVFSLSAMLDLL